MVSNSFPNLPLFNRLFGKGWIRLDLKLYTARVRVRVRVRVLCCDGPWCKRRGWRFRGGVCERVGRSGGVGRKINWERILRYPSRFTGPSHGVQSNKSALDC